MIRIGSHNYDPVRGRLIERETKNADQIFREVKRIRHDLIRAHEITDKELKTLITMVKGGTRNTMYLAPGDSHRRLGALAAYIVREYSYD